MGGEYRMWKWRESVALPYSPFRVWLAGRQMWRVKASRQARDDMVWPNTHSGNVAGSSYWPNTTDQW